MPSLVNDTPSLGNDTPSLVNDTPSLVNTIALGHQAALRWYHKGAAQGNADAEQGLANMYAKGLGVAQDAEVRYPALPG